MNVRWPGSTPIDPAQPDGRSRPAEDVDAVIEEAAQWVVARRLETPALLFLEAHRPLTFLASQSLWVGMPFLAPLFGLRRMEGWSRLLETTGNVDRLIDRIEDLADSRPQPTPHSRPGVTPHSRPLSRKGRGESAADTCGTDSPPSPPAGEGGARGG